MEHELKCWPEPFLATSAGIKRHEVRKNDRNYEVVDVLILQEFDPPENIYSGRSLRVRVTYISKGGDFGLPEDMVVMSVTKSPEPFERLSFVTSGPSVIALTDAEQKQADQEIVEWRCSFHKLKQEMTSIYGDGEREERGRGDEDGEEDGQN